MMRITLLNTFDIAGGAARAAYRLHQGLREIGVAHQFLVARKDSDDPDITPVRPRDAAEQAAWAAREGEGQAELAAYPALQGPGFVPFHSGLAGRADLLEDRLPPTDIFHLHWVRGLVDWPLFFRRRRPDQGLVWTLHDQNPFTGGCHYADACRGFTMACGRCPMLGSVVADDLSALVLARKRAALAAFPGPVHIVSPSRWLAAEAANSRLFAGLPIHVIPNAVDIRTLVPADGAPLRRRLGIADDVLTLGFVSHLLADPRKGLDLLMQALNQLAPSLPDRLTLLVAGEGEVPPVPLSVPCVNAGPQSGDGDLCGFYAACDLLVVPSRQDNLPNVVLEAMACARPVVGFDSGGVPDMIMPGVTGFLAPGSDADALAVGLAAAVRRRADLPAMGQAGRQRAEREYAPVVQARRYAALYVAVDRERKGRR
ncbi:glycosyltransferase [Niveispirillum sp. BGYR6]|uniref:glycosyltransferase n=1 Tax=Niveispirillum sp. BGYR6 TaxID=2971249 RepID=UPI0022B958E4|nr:glycosyltransferase [Niveispirillum sp. BGYR6]MDG5494751.1 glycosyltransferase [Niveispirillum sp. BGYR6]